MSETMERVDKGTNFSGFMNQLASKTRGTDQKDIDHQCLELCQQYLVGKWTALSVDNIDVKQLTSGMANETYRCRVKDSHECEENDVVIRIYGPLNRSDFKSREFGINQIDESIVALMASQNGIGPQVYGLFGKGLIMKYYPHRHFLEEDLYDQDLLHKLACKLAAFHAMKPTLNTTESKVRNAILFFDKRSGAELPKKRAVFRKYNFKALIDFDFKSESEWVFDKISGTDSPLVFSHNDFRIGNVLVLEDKQLVLSDFDMSSYFNRGFDFAILFGDKSVDNSLEFKDESIVKEFIGYYIEENEKIFGKQYLENECNSVEHILLETKVFSMIYTLLAACCLLESDHWGWPIPEQTCMEMSNLMIKRYLVIKKTLLAQNILTN